MKPFQPDGASLAKGPDGRSFSADGRVQKSIEQGAEFTKEKKPEDFLSYRKEGIARISRDVCQRFDNEGLSDEKISAYLIHLNITKKDMNIIEPLIKIELPKLSGLS